MNKSTVKVGLSSALIIFYGLLVTIFGFYLSTVIYLVAHSWVLGQRSWVLLTLFPPALCLILYLLVERFLSIALPRGVLF